jgi:hypothetical protein
VCTKELESGKLEVESGKWKVESGKLGVGKLESWKVGKLENWRVGKKLDRNWDLKLMNIIPELLANAQVDYIRI